MSTTMSRILPLSGERLGTFTELCRVAQDELLPQIATLEAISLLDQAAAGAVKDSGVADFLKRFGGDFPEVKEFWQLGFTPENCRAYMGGRLQACRAAVLAAASAGEDDNERCADLFEALDFLRGYFGAWKLFKAFARWSELKEREEDFAIFAFLGSPGLPEWLTYETQLAEIKKIFASFE